MQTHRVHVSTDLGGDPDDIQSLFRLVHYSDILRVEGISSCTGPGSEPRASLIEEWLRRIDVDHLRERGHDDLQPESDLLSVVEQGPTDAGAPEPGANTPGSDHLIERARAGDPEGERGPLWVLVWGSLTGVAQALHDAPDVAASIRIYSIGSSNTVNDPESRDWLYGFMREEHPDLWWIENGVMPKFSHDTFRGVYAGGVQRGEWGRREFLQRHVRGHGSTRGGAFEGCGDAFPTAHAVGADDGAPERGVLKEGDSPSMLYLLSPVVGGVGDVDDPTRPCWGGRFRRPEPDRFPNYYCDLDADREACWRTINRWRVDYLSDWAERWDRYEHH